MSCTLLPTPYILHPAPYALPLHPAPCTLHPAPYTLHPARFTLHLAHYTSHTTTYTLHTPRPTLYALRPTPLILPPPRMKSWGQSDGMVSGNVRSSPTVMPVMASMRPGRLRRAAPVSSWNFFCLIPSMLSPLQ